MTVGQCLLTHRVDPDRPRAAVDGHLCAGCSRRLSDALRALPGLWSELEGVLAGPWSERVVDDRHPLTAAENPLPLKPAVAQHRSDIAQTLSSWGRLVAEEMGQHPPVPDVGRIVQWLEDRVEWVRAQPWIDDFAGEVVDLQRRALSLLDTGRRTFVFLGPCMVVTDGHGQCQADVYGEQGKQSATCKGCGIEHGVADRREWLLESARTYLATGEEAADFASQYHGFVVRPGTLWKWVQRGHLVAHGKDAEGRSLYLLEDVVTQAGMYGQRRSSTAG